MAEDAATTVEQKAPEATTASDANAPAADAAAPAADAKTDDAQPSKDEDKPSAAEGSAPEKPDADVEMKDAPAPTENKESEAAVAKPDDSKSEAEKQPAADDNAAEMDQDEGAAAPAAEAATPANKDKGRRKSGAASTGKKLNKKQSKAKIQHLDAKPGDHFFARLKGFPPWPVIVCDEDMLPNNMLSSRPVTAARADGSYREEFSDGGKKAGDRTYPVMYLQTNEFSWTRNTDLEDLDASTVADLVTAKMRKDLAQAHVLASESNNLEYYKQVLQDFEEARAADAEAKAARARAKKEKTKKPSPKQDEDVEMADANVEEAEESDGKKSKKRKADEAAATPQRSDSVKKPKIKLTSNTKAAANGNQSPKESTSKPSKPKSKGSKAAKEGDSEKPKKEAAPKEPELTPEEKQIRKEKEILFLRHRLQKGLLTKELAIRESEMASMSDYLSKLEAFPDLEASIIRKTKINKVLKAILKLGDIPKESELNFKPRSQTLLDKWNKILLAEPAPAESSGANGVNGTSGDVAGSKEAKSPLDGVNGEAEASKDTEEEKAESNEDGKAGSKTSESKTTPAEEKPAEEAITTAEPSAAESSA